MWLNLLCTLKCLGKPTPRWFVLTHCTNICHRLHFKKNIHTRMCRSRYAHFCMCVHTHTHIPIQPKEGLDPPFFITRVERYWCWNFRLKPSLKVAKKNFWSTFIVVGFSNPHLTQGKGSSSISLNQSKRIRLVPDTKIFTVIKL